MTTIYTLEKFNMADPINCSNIACGKTIWSGNIVQLITDHRDENGFFICEHCQSAGYIQKNFQLQEQNESWDPILKGIITLGQYGETYQPFVYLVSYNIKSPPCDLWFSYYKDTRKDWGRLKVGHGPGGPPVLGNTDLINLISNHSGPPFLRPYHGPTEVKNSTLMWVGIP
jgi:hypothetical protein